MSAKKLEVVAAVIERRGRWLLAQRPVNKAHGGLWEFPGGKVNPGESLAQALQRELAEELALTAVDVGDELIHYDEPDNGLRLHFMRVATDAAPVLLEHSALGWFRPAEAQGLALAPLDDRFLREMCDTALT